MALEINKTNTYQVNATTDDGKRVELAGVEVTKGRYFNVTEMNGRIGIMSLFEVLGKVSKSGKDTVVIGSLIDLADRNNEIHIPNMSKYADNNNISRESFKRLMKRSVDEGLFYKIDTGHYLVNPYIIMSKGLTNGGYELQETAQLKWREITGLLTGEQIDKLIKLGRYLDKKLRATEFNLSVAEYYYKKGEITNKQRKVLQSETV